MVHSSLLEAVSDLHIPHYDYTKKIFRQPHHCNADLKEAILTYLYQQVDQLGRHFHVYAVDTIGGPGKSVPGEGYDKSFDDAVWITEILDKLGLEKVFMSGVSNGAYLTQMYMIQHPERVIKGVSMAGVPVKTSGSGKKAAMKAMMKVFLPEALFPTDKNVMNLIRKMTGSHYSAFTDNEIVFQHFKQLMTGFRRSAMMNHKVLGFSEEAFLPFRPAALHRRKERSVHHARRRAAGRRTEEISSARRIHGRCLTRDQS